METYPKQIVLEDGKLKKLLEEKEELVMAGRAKSDEIETLEKEMGEIDLEIQTLEKKVDVSHLKSEADKITDQFNKALAEMQAIQKKLFNTMKSQIPKDLGDRYDTIKKEKEKKENERNKIALKVQQKRDKIIPLSRKLMTPHKTDLYDDYDTVRLENGEVVATLFNHLDEFKKNFNKPRN